MRLWFNSKTWGEVAIIFRLITRDFDMNARIFALVAVVGLSLFGTGESRGEHPVSIVNADIFVQRFKTTMRLECYAEDLDLLQGVVPMEDGFYDSEELLEAHQDHAKFLAEKIELIGSDGEKLVAKVTSIGPFEIPEEGIMQGNLMNFRLKYELEYKYEEPPEFLTINQKLIGEGMLLPSELQFVILQAGEEVKGMIKPDMPRVFSFDWSNPLSEDASDEERKKWFEAQQDRTLGIASFSSVYNFIYITDNEVRLEVLVPLYALGSFIDLGNADENFLEIEEQDAVKPLIEALFGSDQIEVKIDGVVVPPVFDRIDFQSLEKLDFMTNAPRARVSMYNGRVGIIMSYSAKSPPQEVSVNWDVFNEVVQLVDTRVIAYDKAELTEFSRFLIDNTYKWNDAGRPPLPEITNVDASKYQIQETRIPVLTIALGVLALLIALFARSLFGAPLALGIATACAAGSILLYGSGVYTMTLSSPENIEAQGEIFGQLHKNVFRAFDYKDKDKIYDALSKSVDGDLLQDFYIDVRNSLRVQEKGGAIANIQQVNLLDGEQIPLSEKSDRPGFGFRSKWNLVGTIEHFGHIHERTTQYEADFDVELVDDSWKITAMQATNQEHGPINADVRKFEEVKDLRDSQKSTQPENTTQESASPSVDKSNEVEDSEKDTADTADSTNF